MATVSKKVYTEKFDNTVSNDNNSWNSAIKCKLLFYLIQTLIRRALSLVLVIKRYQDILAKDNVQFCTKEAFFCQEGKKYCCLDYVIEDLKREEVKSMF